MSYRVVTDSGEWYVNADRYTSDGEYLHFFRDGRCVATVRPGAWEYVREVVDAGGDEPTT